MKNSKEIINPCSEAKGVPDLTAAQNFPLLHITLDLANVGKYFSLKRKKKR